MNEPQNFSISRGFRDAANLHHLEKSIFNPLDYHGPHHFEVPPALKEVLLQPNCRIGQDGSIYIVCGFVSRPPVLTGIGSNKHVESRTKRTVKQ